MSTKQAFEIVTVSGLDVIETKCARGCTRPYRVDANHPQYGNIKAALERGDRSVIVCYHRSLA